ncbi:MAG: DUF2238 domain-containing protein [Candidatus Paceibacterota bacterium]
MLNTLHEHSWVVLFTLAYIFGASVYFVAIGDYEFLWYVAVLVVIAGAVAGTLHRSRFDSVILWGLSIWGLLHMAGGAVPVGNGILYGLTLVPLIDAGNELVILKYDQVVHFFGFAVATLVVYHLIRPYLAGQVNWPIILSVVVLAGMGLGVLNEIVEFIAVLAMPETGVGGYNNTVLDLVFNMFGAAAAVAYLVLDREERVYAHHGMVSRIKSFFHLTE